MSEMVERVAKAIQQLAREYQIDALGDRDAAYLARAAIAEMREPTKAMADEGRTNAWDYSTSDAIEGWHRMIDAALTEP